jgi:hypothetical protein
VQVSASQAGPAAGSLGAMIPAQQRAMISVLAAQPGTLHYLAVSSSQVSLPGGRRQGVHQRLRRHPHLVRLPADLRPLVLGSR